MAQIAKRDFDVLDVTRQKYPQWKDDIIAHLGAMGLEHTIEEVNEYNSALFRISSQLEYCSDEVTDFAKLEKMFSTMGAPNLQYARQLRREKFTKLTNLIAAKAIAKFSHGRWSNRHGRGRGRERVSKPKGACLKCGLIGHWARACRSPKHFVDLYQASIKQANKGPEAHFISDAIPLTSCMPTSNTLDIADYLIDDFAGTSNL
ncbi:hypothetical protein RND81_11G096200 [Saponaria officinalis]|uniref:CCHC-type domain-containing protein n=1 Tax=Saponaria officinalis TaxID=3572 RepID=A0AAW1HK62_SAPOF